MSQLLVRPRKPDAAGCVLEVTPRSAGWTHVGFKVCHLAAGQELTGGTPDRETCIVVLSGTARVAVNDVGLGLVGGRKSVFEDAAPGAVYVPAGPHLSIVAATRLEVAVCSAPGTQPGLPARVIAPEAMSREVRGQETNTRYVRNILPQTEPADSLLVVEVITPGGHWSSYPPHKHDNAVAGQETRLEETYYHRLNPSQGFAFQRVYTDDGDLDETLCVKDGDVVLVPRGYHPVGAPHGYDLYYLNVMAGPERKWIFRNDPAHEWLLHKR
jgi:5-deoxy-glucuronate isomerase